MLTKAIPVKNVLVASEMIGAVCGIDPETGDYYDNTKRNTEVANLTGEDRANIFEHNTHRVFPRLDAAPKQKGL